MTTPDDGRPAPDAASERLRRPPVERTEPLRGWGGLYGLGPNGGATGSNEAVAHGVELGYRVISSYLQEAQRLAGFAAPLASARDGRRESGAQGDVLGTLTTMFVEAVTIWAELGAGMAAALGVELTGQPAGRPARTPQGLDPQPGHDGGEPTRVFDLAPGETATIEVMLPVGAEDPSGVLLLSETAPAIPAVIAPGRARGRIRLTLALPEDRPGARYRAVALVGDETYQLSVVVRAIPPEAL